MKYLVWRCLDKNTEVAMEMLNINQIKIGDLWISWDDNTTLYLRYYSYHRFELSDVGNIIIIRSVDE